jgi:hypothetical protein
MKTTPLILCPLAAALVALAAGPARADGGGATKLEDPKNEVDPKATKFEDPKEDQVGPASALADPLTLVVGVERLFTFSPYTQSGPSEDGGIALTAGWLVNSESSDAQRPFYPHAIPRLALDFVIGQQFSAGAAFGVGSSVGTLDNNLDYDEDEPAPRATTYGLGLRLGYVAPLGRDAVFWPRVGVSHAWASQERKSGYSGELVEDSYAHTALTLEAAFVFVPVLHFGFIIDFTADIGLAGRADIVESTAEAKVVGSRRISDGFGASIGALVFL